MFARSSIFRRRSSRDKVVDDSLAVDDFANMSCVVAISRAFAVNIESSSEDADADEDAADDEDVARKERAEDVTVNDSLILLASELALLRPLVLLPLFLSFDSSTWAVRFAARAAAASATPVTGFGGGAEPLPLPAAAFKLVAPAICIRSCAAADTFAAFGGDDAVSASAGGGGGPAAAAVEGADFGGGGGGSDFFGGGGGNDFFGGGGTDIVDVPSKPC